MWRLLRIVLPLLALTFFILKLDFFFFDSFDKPSPIWHQKCLNLLKRDGGNDEQDRTRRNRVILMFSTVFGDSDYASTIAKGTTNRENNDDDDGDEKGCNGDTICSSQCLVLPTQCSFFQDVVEQSHVLVFHAVRSDLAPALRRYRKLKQAPILNAQLRVFFNLESPDTLAHSLRTELRNRRILNNFFHLALTYQGDSSIQVPPMRFDGIEQIAYSPEQHMARRRFTSASNNKQRRHLAAVISNCQSAFDRLAFLKQLAMYNVQVDIYGKCSPEQRQCPGRRGTDDSDCMQYLSQRYTFVAAFENSICDGYYTEKVLLPLQHWLIPVVIGGAQYESILPPGSFINARKFASPQHLAQYLLKMANNEAKLESFFRWRNSFQLKFNTDNLALCQLCSHLSFSSSTNTIVTDNHNDSFPIIATSTSSSKSSFVNLEDQWLWRPSQGSRACHQI